MIPLSKAVPEMRTRLVSIASYLKENRMHTAAHTLAEASALLQQMLELHTALVEREERLTAEVVQLRP